MASPSLSTPLVVSTVTGRKRQWDHPRLHRARCALRLAGDVHPHQDVCSRTSSVEIMALVWVAVPREAQRTARTMEKRTRPPALVSGYW